MVSCRFSERNRHLCSIWRCGRSYFRRYNRNCPDPSAPASLSSHRPTPTESSSAYTATGFGIESMLRGEDDIKYRLLLASGAGLAYTFLRHGFKAHPFHALSYVAAFTCVSGPTFQLRETLRARSEDSTRGKGF
ncbi:hypothetical protein Bca4012_082657 [Brassica carinata]